MSNILNTPEPLFYRMRAAAVLVVMVSVSFLPPWPQAEAGAAAREWTVSGPENITDETLYAEENITVAPGGKLVLENATLLFNSTEGSPLVLEVQAGGELVLGNSSLAQNGSWPYLVRALAGSKLTVTESSVSGAGTCATDPARAGVLVETDDFSMANSTLRSDAAGLYLRGCTVGFADTLFYGNDIGLVMDGSQATLDRCRFDGQGSLDMLLANGSRVLAASSLLDPAGVVVSDASSRLDIAHLLSVAVFWDDGLPAAGATVGVKPSDGAARFYQVDSPGTVLGIRAVSASVLRNGTQDHGPFNISAASGVWTAWNITEIESDLDIRLILDRNPPDVTIDYPSEGALLNGTPRPASGSARDPFPMEDSPGIRLVEARIDDGPWGPANGTGSWTFALEGLAEGRHTLTVRAWDIAGNSNQSSVGFDVDLRAPSLDAWPPAGHLTNAPNITVRITTDGEAVLFNGTPVAGHVPGRPLEVNWSLDAEGDNRAEVASIDRAGNEARLWLRVVRDTTPPAVSFTSPAPYAVLDRPLASIIGRCSDLHGIVLVEQGPDRQNWTRVNGTEEWSFPFLLVEGENTVYVRATDGAGNTATGWLRLDLRSPDATPPEVRFIYPVDGQEVSSAGLDVSVRATDAGGVRSVQLSLGSGNWTNATPAGDWAGRFVLSAGNNTLRARAFDIAGNVNTTSIIVVYVPPPPDRTPPSLVILYPPAGLKLASGKLIVSGRASDPSGVASVEVSADGARWTPCILAGEDWSGTVTLAPGSNTVRVRAVDGQGNRAESSVKAVLDRPADPAAERATFSLVLVLVGLALLSAWLLARAPERRAIAGAEEE
jgi:hypothetical protein